MVYFFNELSLLTKANSVKSAYEILETFVRSNIAASKLGFKELRLHDLFLKDLYNLGLYENFNIGTWIKDNTVSEELKVRFKEILTSAPLIKADENLQWNQQLQSEFKKEFDGLVYDSHGLGSAYIFDSLSLSLDTHIEWDKVIVQVTYITIDSELEIKSAPILVRHFSKPSHIKSHVDWWQKKKIDELAHLDKFWETRKEEFPNLIFCSEVKQQLQNINSIKQFKQIIDRLKTLNNYLNMWTDGDFNYKEVNNNTNLRISPESQSTLKKFGVQRKFFVENKGKLLFDLHIKTGDLRYHFLPDVDTKKVYIGYIGKHLRIASEN